jgi:hypothetical protein
MMSDLPYLSVRCKGKGIRLFPDVAAAAAKTRDRKQKARDEARAFFKFDSEIEDRARQ